MKKFILTIIIVLIITISSISINYYIKKDEKINNNKTIIEENVSNDIEPEDGIYKDNNPIDKIGLYKYYGKSKERELIKEYIETWQYHTDISSFEVFYTNEEFINNNWLPNTFDEYKNNYSNIDHYKIGFYINFLTNEKEISKTILSPKDTEEFSEYLEIYLYDDYHREKGVWYSHTIEEEFNEITLLTSIKLTAGIKVSEIISDITLTVFTYDSDDFDIDGNYRGNCKYTIVVKRRI